MGQFGFGQSVRRVEDDRFIIGRGKYTDDIRLDGQAHAYMVRSPVAHAKILSIDVSDAKAAPGVLAVLTGADAQAAGLGEVPSVFSLQGRDGKPNYHTFRPVIARDRVRYVGDTVAVVVAETLNQAKDAADLILVDYDDLPVIADLAAAVEPEAPVIWEEHGSNVLLDAENGKEADTEAAFAKASHVTTINLVNHRVVSVAMEPRACVAAYDKEADHYSLYVCSQGVHSLRGNIAKNALKIDPDKLSVYTHDVGGGFGMKNFHYPEYAITLWAARQIARPVKWTGERSDSFISDAQGRDNLTRASLAFDENGRALAIKVDTLAGMGAYLSQFGLVVAVQAAAIFQTGVYDIRHGYQRVRCVATNTVPVDAYRGAARPEAAYVIERLMSKAARELGLSDDEIRRRNFIRPDQMPYTSVSGGVFDSGEFAENMDRAMHKADWKGFEARKAAAAQNGKLLGLGMSYYVERTATAGVETARIEVFPDGEVLIAVGTQNNGQGHETAFAQVVSEFLEVPFDKIRLAPGNSDLLPSGGGTGGSRSLTMGALVLQTASNELIEKGKQLAAEELGAALDNIQYEEAAFKVAGSNEFLSLYDVAKLAAKNGDGEGGLSVTSQHNHSNGITYPNGCHICEVEIDKESGRTHLTRFTVVDDFGRILNPMLVEGQVVGGIVQSIGQAMGEEAVYDKESGQLLTGSFMDYWMPRAADIPPIEFDYNEVFAKTNPFGFKGCGEAGTVGATPAVVNAVIDALHPFGVVDLDMPITPLKVWTILSGLAD